uniref:Putative secreted peptide n=1 Tax=Anopheles braziliensis TaxID=58242 RepID=A0A2M3ZVB4_9DIPT
MLPGTWFCCCLILTLPSSHDAADNTVSVSCSKIAGQRLTGGERVPADCCDRPAAPVECVFGAHTFLAQQCHHWTRAIVVLVLDLPAA